MKEYQKQVKGFVLWSEARSLFWQEFWELDIFLVIYKQASPAFVSRGAFASLIAAVQYAMPWKRGALLWSHAVLERWG